MIKIPEVNEIETLILPDYEKVKLDNKIPVIILNAPDPDIIKLDIVFKAGRFQEDGRAVAKTTAIILKEGTSKMNSAKIAETLDYFGASLSSNASMDTATIQVYCMGKYFKNILEIVNDILTDPVFPEEEIQKFKNRILEKLKVELSKNSVLAYRHLTAKIYGESHPYGYNTEAEDYKNIKREQLVSHFKKYYTPDNCKIFISGNITDDKLKDLNNTLGKMRQQSIKQPERIFEAQDMITGVFKYDTERIHQTAIRMGRRMFDRNNIDYPGMYLLNSVLGGYFGSRLSSNIREDKGYTYGIYSSLDMMLKDGYFTISTDVGNKYLEDTLKEIYKEIKLLQTEFVQEEELTLVKNYIKGNFLSLVNGHLNTINIIKTIEMVGLEKDFFTDFLNKITKTNKHQLVELANKYLNRNDLIEIQVGKTL